MANLAARYTHPERDGILCGRMGIGDISGWATGVSKPFGTPTKPTRPEVVTTRAKFQPIRSLKSVSQMEIIKRARALEVKKVERTVGPGDANKFSPDDHTAKMVKRTIGIALMFENLYKKGVVKRANVEKFKASPAFDPLADCPTSAPAAIEALKGNIIPRE